MIVSNIFREPHEGKDHFQLKKKICELVENRYSKRAAKIKLELQVWSEFNFPVVTTSLGPRAYIGDIVVIIVDSLIGGSGIEEVFNIEVDGFEGHTSRTEMKKNRVRDEALAKGVSFRDKIYPCPVKRILVGKYNDSLLANELDRFFRENRKGVFGFVSS